MKKRSIELTVALPVHNEEKGIAKVIDNLYKTLKKLNTTYEVICIENGSTDNSYKVLQKLAKKYPNLIVTVSEKGWGNAVKKGLKTARGNLFCYSVSDNQVDISIIKVLYDEFKKGYYDMVKIRRKTRENTKRLVTTRVYNMISNILFNVHVYDVNGTPKLLSTSLMKKAKLTSANVAIDLELIIFLQRHNCKILEIPVLSKKRDSGASTTNVKTVIEMLKNMKKFMA